MISIIMPFYKMKSFGIRFVVDTIYDTIMKNVGMSDNHLEFPTDRVADAELYGNTIEILFDTGDRFMVKVTRMQNEQV